MMICDDGHAEIVFDNRICPLCLAKGEKSEWEKEGAELKLRIRELEQKIFDEAGV